MLKNKILKASVLLLSWTTVSVSAASYGGCSQEQEDEMRRREQNCLAAMDRILVSAEESEEYAGQVLTELDRQGQQLANLFSHLYGLDVCLSDGIQLAKAMKFRSDHFFIAFAYNPYAKQLSPDLYSKFKDYHQGKGREARASNGSVKRAQTFLPKVAAGSGMSNSGVSTSPSFEAKLDDRLNQFSGVVARVKRMSIAMGEELDLQNSELNHLAGETTYQTERANRAARITEQVR